MLVEVQFNEEEPLVVVASPFPGNKEKFDLTQTVETARVQRRLENPEAEDFDEETLVITAHRFVPEEE